MKLVGERRALAAIVFAFYFIFLVLNGLMMGGQEGNMLLALGGCYGLAFFALVAGYFWARWYAVGIGLFGVIIAVVSLWQMRGDPDMLEAIWRTLAFIGGTHALAAMLLWGDGMAAPYDGQTAWREKLHMDDNAVQRLGRSVIRAGVGLPFVLSYAFAPKQGMESAVLAVIALGLAGFGLRAVIRARTWGLFAIGLAGSVMITLSMADLAMGSSEMWALRPALAGGLLFSAAAPWFAPLARTFASSR